MRGRNRRLTRIAACVALAASGAACQLADVTTPGGEDVLVVEAVLRAGEPVQRILLHRTLTGGAVRGEPNAQVGVRTPTGETIVFEPDPEALCITVADVIVDDEQEVPVRPTCFRSPEAAGAFVQPGATYELRVTTPDGLNLRGRTAVPGDFRLLAVGDDRATAVCTFGAGISDTLVWTQSEGAWAYRAQLTVRDLPNALPAISGRVPDPLELSGLAIGAADTVLVLPSEFGTFERFELNQDLLRALQGGLPAGANISVLIAATDRNYVNSVRGGGFNPSGNVRINSVAGDGVGVFASLVPRMIVGPVTAGTKQLVECAAGAGAT